MKNHTKLSRTLKLATSMGLVSFISIPTVMARGVDAMSGRARFGSDETCFVHQANSITNMCAAAKTFNVPLVLDSYGAKSITFSAADGVSCRGYASSETALTSVSGTLATINAGPSTRTTDGFSVASAGRAWLSCTIQSGGRLLQANYNQ